MRPPARKRFHDEAARRAAVQSALNWVEDQAHRLQTTARTITDAVARGWTAQEVELVGSKFELSGPPPMRDLG